MDSQVEADFTRSESDATVVMCVAYSVLCLFCLTPPIGRNGLILTVLFLNILWSGSIGSRAGLYLIDCPQLLWVIFEAYQHRDIP